METSFLPGRTFRDPQDFNAQLHEFTAKANRRRRRVLGCAAGDRIDADRAGMLGLPPVAPVTGWRQALRLPRDHYIRVDSNDYSVHPAAIGQRIEVVADLQLVRAFSEGRCIAEHERIWARHQTVSDAAHVQAARALRAEHRVVVRRLRDDREVELRRLTDYDAACGVDDPEVA